MCAYVLLLLNVNWTEFAVETVMELARNDNFHVCNVIMTVYLRSHFIIIHNHNIIYTLHATICNTYRFKIFEQYIYLVIILLWSRGPKRRCCGERITSAAHFRIVSTPVNMYYILYTSDI